MEVEAGGVFLQSFVQRNSINVNGGIHKCNVLEALFEGDGKLGGRVAALSDPKLYKKLRENYLSRGLGLSAAKTIHRFALTCKQYPDMTPIKSMLTHFEEAEPVNQAYKLFELRNFLMVSGVSEEEANQVLSYQFIRGVVSRKPKWRENTVVWCRDNLQYRIGKSVPAQELRDVFRGEGGGATIGWPQQNLQNLEGYRAANSREFRVILMPAVIAACSEDDMDDSPRPWYDQDAKPVCFMNVAWKKEPSSGAQPNVHAPAPAPMSDSSEDEKKEPDASSSDDCEIIEPPSPAPVDDALSGSAPAPAPVALDSSDDDDMRAAKEASYEQFLTEQEAKLYGQIGSSDEQKESGSSSSDEVKITGSQTPDGVVYVNEDSPTSPVAEAPVEEAAAPAPAASSRSRRPAPWHLATAGVDPDAADDDDDDDDDDDEWL